MRKNVLRTALVLISAAVMVYAAHRIYQEHSEYREGADSYSVLEAYIKETQTEPMPEESKPEQDEMSENAIAWPVVDFAALRASILIALHGSELTEQRSTTLLYKGMTTASI